MANSHPGSYCGQDAYNDMFVVEKENELFVPEDRGVQRIGTGIESETEGLQGCDRPDASRGGIDVDNEKMVVRRLTPLTCERLQGFPDGWTQLGEWTDSNGKKHKESDSARYRALGNSIALPYWFHLLRRISAEYERPATLGGLFSGIGGFELCWARCNGAKNVLWSSEIEQFPIAVLKRHFGDEETGEEGDIKDFLWE